MKYFISTCLLAFALFLGVNTISVVQYESNCADQKIAAEHPTLTNHLSNERQVFLSSTNFQPYAFANEQISISFSSQNVSIRAFSSSNASRIIYSSQLTNREFRAADSSFSLQFANKQLAGYYLYHLCKLLI